MCYKKPTAQWNLVIKDLKSSILSGCTNKWLGIVCQFPTETSFHHIILCCGDPPIEIASPLGPNWFFSKDFCLYNGGTHTGIYIFIITLRQSVNYFQFVTWLKKCLDVLNKRFFYDFAYPQWRPLKFSSNKAKTIIFNFWTSQSTF